ncbi:MAG: Ig domain-containing protein [Bacteroidales bacterium]|nr:Ig domain-containing protein [Bacteroidales bacterium]
MKHRFTVLLLGALVLWACGKNTEDPTIHVRSVSIIPSQTTLYLEETLHLRATVTPSNAVNKDITWASDQPTVASVTAEGLVTALTEGTAVITATADGISGTCRVRVIKEDKPVIEVASVTISPESLTLVYGEGGALTATVLPENATYPAITWASSDESVITVSSEGVVTSVSAGTATITATAKNGVSGECPVTVTPYAAFSVQYLNPRTSQWADALTGIYGYPGGNVQIKINEVRNDGPVSYSVDAATYAGYADGKVLLYAPGDAVLTVGNTKGYSLQVPLHSNLANVFYFGNDPKDLESTLIMDRYSSSTVSLAYSDAEGLLPIPASAYTLTSTPAGLLTFAGSASNWGITAGSQKGTATVQLKMGTWVDRTLCTVIINDNVPPGETEDLTETPIDLD